MSLLMICRLMQIDADLYMEEALAIVMTMCMSLLMICLLMQIDVDLHMETTIQAWEQRFYTSRFLYLVPASIEVHRTW